MSDNTTPAVTRKPRIVEFSPDDLANVLAALRYWQEFAPMIERIHDDHMSAGENRAYTDKDLDDLCKRIDFGG